MMMSDFCLADFQAIPAFSIFQNSLPKSWRLLDVTKYNENPRCEVLQSDADDLPGFLREQLVIDVLVGVCDDDTGTPFIRGVCRFKVWAQETGVAAERVSQQGDWEWLANSHIPLFHVLVHTGTQQVFVRPPKNVLGAMAYESGTPEGQILLMRQVRRCLEGKANAEAFQRCFTRLLGHLESMRRLRAGAESATDATRPRAAKITALFALVDDIWEMVGLLDLDVRKFSLQPVTTQRPWHELADPRKRRYSLLIEALDDIEPVFRATVAAMNVTAPRAWWNEANPYHEVLQELLDCPGRQRSSR